MTTPKLIDTSRLYIDRGGGEMHCAHCDAGPDQQGAHHERCPVGLLESAVVTVSAYGDEEEYSDHWVERAGATPELAGANLMRALLTRHDPAHDPIEVRIEVPSLLTEPEVHDRVRAGMIEAKTHIDAERKAAEDRKRYIGMAKAYTNEHNALKALREDLTPEAYTRREKALRERHAEILAIMETSVFSRSEYEAAYEKATK